MARRRVIVVVSVIGVMASAWWLFGWSTPDERITLHRYFGRVTSVDIVDNESPRRMRAFYSWNDPYTGVEGECGGTFHEYWEDSNGDDRWDLWAVRVEGPPRCLWEYRVDTSGDGSRDWVFRAAAMDRDETYASIRSRRGF